MKSDTCLKGWSSFARVALLAGALLTVACSGTEDDVGAEDHNQTAFLDPASYADLITIAPSFPFGVTRRQAVAGGVLGARWGNHGGPVVTTADFANPSRPLKVSRIGFTTAATGDATRTELTSVLPSNLPAQRFWAADGFVDLPFGSLSMVSYSTSSSSFTGELLFYSKDYDRVVSRAHVNGYYGGVGLTDGATRRVVYTGLSGLTSSPSTANESALYASTICGESVAPAAGCAQTQKLFGWSGFSGPVATDAEGNVFVAAAVTGGAHTDAIYALTKSQALATTAAQKSTIADRDTGGTGSLAAIASPEASEGWLVAKGYDGDVTAPVYARAYHSTGSAVVPDGAIIEDAIRAPADASTSVFSDPTGHLWVAVEAPSGSWLLQLEKRP